MGLVTFELEPIHSLSLYTRMVYGGEHPDPARFPTVDKARVEAAVRTLGIKSDVVFRRMLHQGVNGYVADPVPATGLTLPFEVWLNADRPTERGNPDDMSRTIWHELGHIVDMEVTAEVRGIAPYEVFRENYAAHYETVQASLRATSPEDPAFQAYLELPTEKFANAVADAHAGYPPLVRPAGALVS